MRNIYRYSCVSCASTVSNSLCLSFSACEAPSAVQDLIAEAEDSVSIRVSWRSPAQPNGPITQYRLQVLVDDTLLQDITLTAEMVSNCDSWHHMHVLEPIRLFSVLTKELILWT